MRVASAMRRADGRGTGLRADFSAWAASRISSPTYSSFSSAFQPRYRLRHSRSGTPSHTANVSAKSSSGCACAYQFGRWRTKLFEYGRGR